jgi:hypothetical protein
VHVSTPNNRAKKVTGLSALRYEKRREKGISYSDVGRVLRIVVLESGIESVMFIALSV